MDRERHSEGADLPAVDTAVSVDREGDVVVLRVEGELDLVTAYRVPEALSENPEVGGSRILVDLTACDFIDSSGIRALIVERRRMDPNGDPEGPLMAIAAREGQVLRVLRLTVIDELIPIADSRAAALELLG